MRLFISVNLPFEVRRKLINIQNDVKKIISKIRTLNIKWEKEENFHITVFFLGEVAKEKLNNIVSVLSSIKLEPKLVEIKGKCINAFPNLRYPRVIFVDLIDESDWLSKLFIEVCQKLEPVGFKPDKNFHNHITLARIKTPIKFPPDINLKNINCDFTIKVNSFYLMESTLTPSGSIYRIVKKFD